MGTPAETGPAVELDDSGHWLAGLSAPTRSLRDVLDASRVLVTRHARQMGIGPTDMRALRLLDVRGPLGASELAHHLDLRPASVTTLVDRLEAAGMLERVRTGSDRRRVTIRATPAALALSLRTWAPTIQAMDALGHALDPAARAAVCAYLDAVSAVLTDPPAAAEGTDPGTG